MTRYSEIAECDYCGERFEGTDEELSEAGWMWRGVESDKHYNDHQCPRCLKSE